MSAIRSDPSPEGIADAADLIAREGHDRVDEDHVLAKLEEVRQYHGDRWDRAREALHGALGQLRKAKTGGGQ